MRQVKTGGNMANGDIYLTQDGYNRLHDELEYLKMIKRREISKAIGEAREHGDISENAEYDAAKDAQVLNERRIMELEDKLSRARILEDEDIPKNEVIIGATVRLKDLDSAEEIEYMLVAVEEADYTQNRISVASPVGSGLIGHKQGDEVEIKIPAGILRYQILSISR